MDFRIEGQRLFLDGEPLSMFSGSYQYWRIEPRLWSDILEKVKGMGFGVIETYIPWSVHEVERGHFEFGRTDPQRDLPRFLELCGKAGVKVLARPGPHINAELTYFGYPGRLFEDDDMLCRSADGAPVVLPATPRMFPVPCYHNPAFLSEFRCYFEALAEHLRGALHPDGPVIAIQVDNEFSKFLRAHPFDSDYSEYSIKLYRKFLQEKYVSTEELRAAHRAGYGSWQLVDPPRRFDPSSRGELPRYLDWVEFGEHYILEALRSIAGIIRDGVGEGVPLFHNYSVPLPLPPLDLAGAEEFLDFQAVDAYPTPGQYHQLRWGMKYTTTMSRLPVLAEFSSGSTYYAPPVSLEDQRFTTWAALMHGIRGINFYMIVERERWYGSPVKRDGTSREPHREFFERLLSEARSWGLEDMTPLRPVLLLINREYERLASAATLLPPNSRLVDMFFTTAGGYTDMLVSEERYGLDESVASRYARLLNFWYWTLSAAGVHFAIADTACRPGLLSRHRLVITPTFEFLDRGVQEELLGYATGGGTLVLGPRAPRFDSRMEPCGALGRNLRKPVEVRAGGQVFGVPAEEVSLFDGAGAGGADQRSMLYREPAGSGSLVHLGLVPCAVGSALEAAAFGPLVDTLQRMAGVDPLLVPSDPRVDVSVFTGGGRTLCFVANPTHEALQISLSHAGGGAFRDLRTGRETEGEPARVETGPYCITALERL